MTLLLVVLGAAVGAPLRYVVDRTIQLRHGSDFPWGTCTVNLVACLALGVVTGAMVSGAAGSDVEALVGTGLCGTLSTYSTFSFETLRLAETDNRTLAFLNVAVSVGAGLGAAIVGAAIAATIWR
jgi:fluoride exporter